MNGSTTEGMHPLAPGLDARPAIKVADILLKGQVDAAQSVASAQAAIADAAGHMARTIGAGGALYYCAAGSSGLMGAADAMELGGTYGISSSQVRIVMAGGMPTTPDMPGDTEDAVDDLDRALTDLSETDTVIAISASGTTPFTLAASKIAKSRGAFVISIANNEDATLFKLSDCPVLLPTPSEVISGSTRMGAGTAQKIALNMMSTLMALELGHIHDGMMVNLRADNAKLRDRARRMVETIANVDNHAASHALDATGGDVKAATLLAAGLTDFTEASALLHASNGHLRPALDTVRARSQGPEETR